MTYRLDQVHSEAWSSDQIAIGLTHNKHEQAWVLLTAALPIIVTKTVERQYCAEIERTCAG